MKKTALFFAIVLVFTSLCGCGGQKPSAEIVRSDENTVIIRVNETGGSLEDAMNALAESGELSFDGSESEYGFFITSVNGVSADPASQYWAVYTTLGDYEGVSYSNAEYGTFDHDGATLNSASYGISGLPAAEGELYALTLETFA